MLGFSQHALWIRKRIVLWYICCLFFSGITMFSDQSPGDQIACDQSSSVMNSPVISTARTILSETRFRLMLS